MTRSARRVGSALVLVTFGFSIIWAFSVGLIALYKFDELVKILEIYLSKDRNISYPRTATLQLAIAPFTHLLPFIAIVCIFFRWATSALMLISCYSLFFLLHMVGYVFLVGTSSPLIAEDDLLESATCILALTASIIFLVSGLRGCKAAYILAFLWFFFAMEEISWGQRVINFSSPKVFLDLNLQQETTIHNFLHQINDLYILVSFSILLLLTWLRDVPIRQRFENVGLDLIFDASDRYKVWFFPALLTLLLVLSGTNDFFHEFAEQQWSIIGVLFSLSIIFEQKARHRQTVNKK